MRVLKVFGIVLLGIMGLGAIGQLLMGLLATVVILRNEAGGNLSYVMGQIAGAAIMLALATAGIKALRKSLRPNIADSSKP